MPHPHRPARSLRTALAVALVGLAPLAACSGDGDSGATGPTREAYVARALPICEATQERIAEATADIDQSTGEGRADYVRTVAEEVLATLAELRALDAPSDDAAALEQAFATYERRFREWEADPASAMTGAVSADLTAAARQLDEYGLGPCGSGGAGG